MDAHPDQQYFRWKEEICKFIDDYWSYLLPDKEQSPTWNNTVASVLSVQNHIFLSGVETKGASGWWTLIEKAPPDRNRSKQLNLYNRQQLKPKNKATQKPGNPRHASLKSKEKRARAKGSPSKKKTKFDETSSDDDFHTSAKPRPQTSAPTTRIKVDVSYLSSHPQVGGGKKFSQAHIEAMTKAMVSSSKAGSKPRVRSKPKFKVVSSSISHPVHDGPSLEGLSLTDIPSTPPALTLQQMQRQQEWHILQVLEDASKTKALPTVAARFKRKLHLKRLKAFLQLPLFDMENYMRQHLTSPLDLTPLSKRIPPDPYELRRLREEQFRTKIQKIDHTPYGHSFASRLLGQPVECQTRKPWEPLWKSPFSGKILKDFIWRDYESRSAMMDVLDEIKMRQGHPAKGEDKPTPVQSRAPIDYCYFRKEHLAQVNETLCRRFWPGIDMTEALQYPEYSVVVLYKRLVVGCAFMTPEGYITYVAVSAGWEKAGIGQIMLYHLMQASNGKDITLHVSANNPAMIMYQKFGFKPEQFLINFYKEYLPQDSPMCHNAFFVRLRR
ncbi:hypothetical protein EDD21DRAFT_306851 [Dissophora ornata]|nr:hypothetical protein EDD21DRAFT_306851 [Dissophora ornata]